MHEQDSTLKPAAQPREDRGPAEASEPRANPETDEQSVQKGKEQLDKVSGN